MTTMHRRQAIRALESAHAQQRREREGQPVAGLLIALVIALVLALGIAIDLHTIIGGIFNGQ
jgi:capsular polysaccharide biosynthesis protein